MESMASSLRRGEGIPNRGGRARWKSMAGGEGGGGSVVLAFVQR